MQNLVAQLEQLDIPMETSLPTGFQNDYDLLLDGIFGFSFNPDGGIRPPFDQILQEMASSEVPIVSIDIPSGWNVELGPPAANSEVIFVDCHNFSQDFLLLHVDCIIVAGNANLAHRAKACC